MQAVCADEADADGETSHNVSADPNTLLVTPPVDGLATSKLAVEIYNPQGLLIRSVAVLGPTVAIEPVTLTGPCTVKVHNEGPEAIGFSTTLIRS